MRITAINRKVLPRRLPHPHKFTLPRMHNLCSLKKNAKRRVGRAVEMRGGVQRMNTKGEEFGGSGCGGWNSEVAR